MSQFSLKGQVKYNREFQGEAKGNALQPQSNSLNSEGEAPLLVLKLESSGERRVRRSSDALAVGQPSMKPLDISRTGRVY